MCAEGNREKLRVAALMPVAIYDCWVGTAQALPSISRVHLLFLQSIRCVLVTQRPKAIFNNRAIFPSAGKAY